MTIHLMNFLTEPLESWVFKILLLLSGIRVNKTTAKHPPTHRTTFVVVKKNDVKENTSWAEGLGTFIQPVSQNLATPLPMADIQHCLFVGHLGLSAATTLADVYNASLRNLLQELLQILMPNETDNAFTTCLREVLCLSFYFYFSDVIAFLSRT